MIGLICIIRLVMFDYYSKSDPLLPQATNEVITRVPISTPAEMQAAVDAAKSAFKPWSQTSILTRQQTMFKLQQLIRENMVS